MATKETKISQGSIFPPSSAGSDLAYETMYDDEDPMETQTMPWFDPKYLASTNRDKAVGINKTLYLNIGGGKQEGIQHPGYNNI